MIIIDIETTGLDPRKHSLLSIGAINFDDPSENFYSECRMFEGASVMEEVLELNGFSEAQIKDKSKPTPSELIEQFVEWISKFDDQTIGGHNVYSDLGFLRIEAAKADLDYRFSYRIVDLHSVAYTRNLQSKGHLVLENEKTGLQLDDILHFVGLNDDRDIYHALGDAKLEAECFSRLIYGKNLIEEFKKNPVPDYLK